ncbi:RHS repeat protein [Escherichia coli]|nr:RHS repeat protein [Escherichia coli]
MDAAGNSWCCEYDERGNLLAVTDPLQQNTRYQYDRHGQVVQITDARGGNKYLQWNEDGQLMRHTDCSGSQTALVLRRTHAADTDDRRAEPQHALRV